MNSNRIPSKDQTQHKRSEDGTPVQVCEQSYPALTIKQVSSIYGYDRKYIRNLCQWGYLHSYVITAYGRPLRLVHTKSINAWSRMQWNRLNK